VNNVDFMEDEVTQGVPALFPVNIHSTNAENYSFIVIRGCRVGPIIDPQSHFTTRINYNVTNTFFPDKSEVQYNI
jgi:hypothetical protein